jgi:hypothetical protein
MNRGNFLEIKNKFLARRFKVSIMGVDIVFGIVFIQP